MAKELEIPLAIPNERAVASLEQLGRKVREQEALARRASEQMRDTHGRFVSAKIEGETRAHRVQADLAARAANQQENLLDRRRRMQEDLDASVVRSGRVSLGSIVTLGTAFAAVVGHTREMVKALGEAVDRQREMAKASLDFQAKLRTTAYTMGRSNDRSLAREARDLIAETGLAPEEGLGYMEIFAGAAAQFEKNLTGPEESTKLRSLVGKEIARLGGSKTVAENMAFITSQIMSQREGQTAEDVFAELFSITKILGDSTSPPEVLSRELVQAGSPAIASKQVKDWREAAALVATAGNVSGGTSGTMVEQSLRLLTRPTELRAEAGIEEGMGAVEGFRRIFEVFERKESEGRVLADYLAEMKIPAEDSKGILSLYKERQAFEQNITKARNALPAGAAIEEMDRKRAEDESLQEQLAINKKEAIRLSKAEKNRALVMVRHEAEAALEQEGRGPEDYGAIADRRSVFRPGYLYDQIFGEGAQEGGYERDVQAKMAEILKVKGAPLPSNVGIWERMFDQEIGAREAAAVNDPKNPLLYENLTAAAENRRVFGGAADRDPQMDEQTELLARIAAGIERQAGGSGKPGSAPVSTPARPMTGPRPPGAMGR